MPEALPAGLPLPLAASHGRGDESVFAAMQTGIGSARMRRVRRRPMQTATLTWRLLPAQLQAFEDWFEDTLRAGALAFVCPVMTRGAFAVETQTARFAEPPRYTHGPGYCDVAASVVLGAFSENGQEPVSDGAGLIPSPTPVGTMVWVRNGAFPPGGAWDATARTNWPAHLAANLLYQLGYVAPVLSTTFLTDLPAYRDVSVSFGATEIWPPGSVTLSAVLRQWDGSTWVAL